MQKEKLAKEIISLVGGVENIIYLTHCITRLRFKLKDEKLAETETLKKLKGIVNILQSSGQYQVIIGPYVQEVYNEINKHHNFNLHQTQKFAQKKSSIINNFIVLISGLFQPMLIVLSAAGIIKGIAAILLAANVSADNGTYKIIQAAGDGMFYFLPFFLAYTASKKFNLNIFIGFTLAAAILYPTLATTGEPIYVLFPNTWFESKIYYSFLEIPVISLNYSSTVIPIILIIYLASKFHQLFSKLIPSILKIFLAPTLTLLIIVPLALIVIGPIATWISNIIGNIILLIYAKSPIISGILLGFIWQILVIFGVHWGLVPIIINNLATIGFDPILGLILTVSFAQIGAVIGVLIMEWKNKELRLLAFPAILSGVFGITEQAIYGISLPRKKPFIASCLAAAITAGIAGGVGMIAFNLSGLGVFLYIGFIDVNKGIGWNFYYSLILSISALILGGLFTGLFHYWKTPVFMYKFLQQMKQKLAFYFIWQQKIQHYKIVSKSFCKKQVAWIYHHRIYHFFFALLHKQAVKIYAPVQGEIQALANINQDVLSSEMFGKGVGIAFNDKHVYAPCSGKLVKFLATEIALVIEKTDQSQIMLWLDKTNIKIIKQYSQLQPDQVIQQGQLLLEIASIDATKMQLAVLVLEAKNNIYLPKWKMHTQAQEVLFWWKKEQQ